MIFDSVKAPKHYAGDGKIECRDALRSMITNRDDISWMSLETGYWWGCAFKYLWRWPHKNILEDIDKAIRCLEYMRESVESDLRTSNREDERDEQ